MSTHTKRTFVLDDERAAFIDSAVASGRFEDADAVVSAGLRALQDQDDMLELWLRNDVVPVVSAMRADPSRAIPADRVFAELRALQEKPEKS